jgi:hypothetical protein
MGETESFDRRVLFGDRFNGGATGATTETAQSADRFGRECSFQSPTFAQLERS